MSANWNRNRRIVGLINIEIEEINDNSMTKEEIRHALLRREDFLIKALGTLEPKGFNERLNFPSHAQRSEVTHSSEAMTANDVSADGS